MAKWTGRIEDGRMVYRDENGNLPTDKDTSRWKSNLSQILEARTAPGLVTDTTFFRGMPVLGNDMDKRNLDHRVQLAAKRGEKLDPNLPYQPCLAMKKGDPRAQINPHLEGRAGIKRRLEEMGLKVNSPFDLRQPEARNDIEPRKGRKLSRNIIKQEMQSRLQENPSLRRKPRRELVEQIVHEHGAR